MGHASQIALGLALGLPDRRVCVLDGDGAAVMHLGGLAVIAEHAPPNLYHVLFDNHAHESVGGQPTPTERLDFPALALAAGYAWAGSADGLDAVPERVEALCSRDGPALLEIRIRQGSRPDLGRPRESPAENREQFTSWLAR
jgi:phosphonopyruvate decarboxylase